MTTVHPSDYMHELDKKALDELKSIPGFDGILKAFFRIFNEESMHGMNMASKIRLSEKQIPSVYRLLPPLCRKLSIAEPELYI